MALKWYAARTRPLAEYMTRDQFMMSGLEVYLPCAQTRSPRPGYQDAPLFPGYLFVHYDLERHGWSVLRRAPQFAGLVSFGGEVPSVPDRVMEEMVRWVDGINGIGGLWTRYRAGERVRVGLGPLESLAEVLEEPKSPQAPVRVLLRFLGQLVEANVPWREVRPMGFHELAGDAGTRPKRRTRGKGRWIRDCAPEALSQRHTTR